MSNALEHGLPMANIYRACQLCSHAVKEVGHIRCGSPAARLNGGVEPLNQARSAQGSCGPNARHLDMPGWHR